MYNVLKGNIVNVRDYIQTRGIKVYENDRRSHIVAKYKSFMIIISKFNKNKLLGKSFFSNDIKCKNWIYHNYNNNNKPVKPNSYTNKSYK